MNFGNLAKSIINQSSFVQFINNACNTHSRKRKLLWLNYIYCTSKTAQISKLKQDKKKIVRTKKITIIN